MKRGFTYIELLMVLAILAIVISIAIIKSPDLTGLAERIEVKQLQRDLNWAKAMAMNRRSVVKVTFYPADSSYRIDLVGSQNKRVIQLNKLKLRGYKIGDNLTHLEYQASGSVNSGAEVTLQGSRTYSITIQSVTGKVNIKEVQ